MESKNTKVYESSLNLEKEKKEQSYQCCFIPGRKT